MRKRSSYSVRPRSSEDITGSLRELVRKLQAFRLRAMILFGSRAKSEATRYSDVDLIVVLDEAPGDWLQRMHTVSRLTDLPLQPIVLTPEELVEAIKRPSFVILDALEEGVVIHDDGTWGRALTLYSQVKVSYKLRKEGVRWRFDPLSIPY